MPTTLPPSGEVADQLRAVLAAVEAGDMDATDAERTYLRGAADALAAVDCSSTDPA
jgi:hypothetical protein